MVDKSEKFSLLVRIGYFSRAILYAAAGLIALGSSGTMADGTSDIFAALRAVPFSTAIFLAMAVGLAAYGLFRLASPVFDIENEGSDAKGWGKRLGHAGSGIGHFALAWSAWQFATGDAPSGGGAQEAAAGVLSLQFGGFVIGLLGLAFFIAAFNQAKKGLSGDFMQRISPSAPRHTRTLGAIGYLARAVVFAVIGWSLVQAGFAGSGSERVRTLGGAVSSLADKGAVFTLVAVGLLAFGLLSLILARYRIIPDLDEHAGVPSIRS